MSLERFQVPSDSSSTPQDHLYFYTPFCNRYDLLHIGLKFLLLKDALEYSFFIHMKSLAGFLKISHIVYHLFFVLSILGIGKAL